MQCPNQWWPKTCMDYKDQQRLSSFKLLSYKNRIVIRSVYKKQAERLLLGSLFYKNLLNGMFSKSYFNFSGTKLTTLFINKKTAAFADVLLS